MDKPFTILPDAPAMPGAKASPFYVQKEKKGEQKSYRTITHWHDELECLTILDGTLDFQLNESVISLQKGSRKSFSTACSQEASRIVRVIDSISLLSLRSIVFILSVSS